MNIWQGFHSKRIWRSFGKYTAEFFVYRVVIGYRVQRLVQGKDDLERLVDFCQNLACNTSANTYQT